MLIEEVLDLGLVYGQKKESCKGGLLNIWKPAGITSMQVVRKIKTLSKESKVGHVGTLDPFADGVLPVAIGKSTNMIKYMNSYTKTYRVMINFGESTTTQDISGEVVREDRLTEETLAIFEHNNFEKIKNAATNLSGKIMQEVPRYSAVKVDGKPMYWYSRNEIEVQTKTREAYVYEVKFIAAGINRTSSTEDAKGLIKLDETLNRKFTWADFEKFCPTQARARREFFPGLDQSFSELDAANFVKLPQAWAVFDLTVSSGTYVRTWTEDLAKSCGLAAYAFSLRRLASGPYRLDKSLKLDSIMKTVEMEELRDFDNSKILLSPETARPDFPVLNLDYLETIKILHGQKINANKHLEKIFEQVDRLNRNNLGITGSEDHAHDIYLSLFFDKKFLGLAKLINSERGRAIQAERMLTGVESFKARFEQN